MENETFRAYPRVSGAVLAVVEHFAIETFVGVVSGLLATASEFRLRQELGETVGFFFLFFQFLSFFLQTTTIITVFLYTTRYFSVRTRNLFNCDSRGWRKEKLKFWKYRHHWQQCGQRKYFLVYYIILYQPCCLFERSTHKSTKFAYARRRVVRWRI